MAYFLSIFTKEQHHPDSPFDLLPDDVIRIIFNKVQDAKTLLASFSLNKRLASIIPQTNVVSLSLNLPTKKKDNNDDENYNNRIRNNENHTNGNYINIAKSAANYLITKLLRRNNNNLRDSDYDSIVDLRQRLRPFYQIKHLRLELHTDSQKTQYELLKWKANYSREFKSLNMLLCEVSFRHFIAGEWLPEQEHEREVYYVPDYFGRDQPTIMLSQCMKAALERHHMVKEMLPFLPTLETVTITDAMSRGRFSMSKRDARDLRESLKEERVKKVQPWLVLRKWHKQLLELPSVRGTWKEAMLLVVDPVHGIQAKTEYSEPEVDPVHGDPPFVPVVKVEGGGEGYECDAEERTVFEEAQREILTTSQGVKHTWQWGRWNWLLR